MSAVNAYFENLSALLSRTLETQQDALETAARHIADALREGGMVYTFGTGHGHLLALEVFYRAGGMARVCPIMDEKLMLHVSAAGSTLEERRDELEEHKEHARRLQEELAVEGRRSQALEEVLGDLRAEARNNVKKPRGSQSKGNIKCKCPGVDVCQVGPRNSQESLQAGGKQANA